MTLKKGFTYRNIWMGIAILLVVYYHSGLPMGPGILRYLKLWGFCGVDIFLLAAGIGSYYSYLRDENPVAYLKRRVLRLAPAYIPFIIVWLAYRHVIGQATKLDIVGNLLGIQGFSNAGLYFNWYLIAILVCYLLTPFFATFVKQKSNGKCFVLLVVLLLMSSAFWTDSKLIIVAARVPMFFLGMIAAKNENLNISGKATFVAALLWIVGNISLFFGYRLDAKYLWGYGLLWYPFLLMIPFVCILISCVAMFMESVRGLRGINRIVGMIGQSSFELFLLHIFLFEVANRHWLSKWEDSSSKQGFIYCGVAGVIILAILYHFMIEFVKKRIIKRG